MTFRSSVRDQTGMQFAVCSSAIFRADEQVKQPRQLCRVRSIQVFTDCCIYRFGVNRPHLLAHRLARSRRRNQSSPTVVVAWVGFNELCGFHAIEQPRQIGLRKQQPRLKVAWPQWARPLQF